MNKARDVILAALGTCEKKDAQSALRQVIGVLQAEAEVLMSEFTSGVSEHSLKSLELAHKYRLEALEALVEDHLVVTWSESAAESEPAQ